MERHTWTPADPDTLLDYAEAAAQLHVTERLVRKLVERRELASVKIGRLVRIEPCAIECYLNTHRREATT